MPDLKEIGGGVKMLDVTGDDQLASAQKQLGLADLYNRVQAAPVEAKIKQIEMALKGNDLLNVEVENEMKAAQLRTAKADEWRKSVEFANQQMLHLREGFQQGFEMGDAMLKQATGGQGIAKQGEDGSVSIFIPGSSPIKIYPTAITDPKTLNEAVENRAEKWSKMTAKYQTVYTQHANATQLLQLGTGEADRSAIYAMARLQDPLGSVRDGDVDSIIKSPNISQQVKNWAIRASTTEGPVFGDVGSPTRKSMQTTIDVWKDNEKSVLEPQAKGFIQALSMDRGLDPRKIILPVGDITLEGLTGQSQAITEVPPPPRPGGEAPATPASQPAMPPVYPQGQKPVEAGVLNTNPNAPKKAVAPTLKYEGSKKGFQQLLQLQTFPNGLPRK